MQKKRTKKHQIFEKLEDLENRPYWNIGRALANAKAIAWLVCVNNQKCQTYAKNDSTITLAVAFG